MREISTRNKPSCPPHEAMAALGKFHFSDSQRDILRSCYYERGIRSVSKDNEAILQAIAEEIKATPEQVKVVLSLQLINYGSFILYTEVLHKLLLVNFFLSLSAG